MSCSTSGVERPNQGQGVGNASLGGICHTWTEDGRCVSLLKVLLTNHCEYDCAYCANRRSNDIARAAFQPEELADLTIAFYRRNYIEGLFLSSGVIAQPGPHHGADDPYLALLRGTSITSTAISMPRPFPGTSPDLIEKLGLLADRISVNIEQCTTASLQLSGAAEDRAGHRPADAVICQTAARPIATSWSVTGMRRLSRRPARARRSSSAPVRNAICRSSPRHSACTSDYQLKRVYYSAYMPINRTAACRRCNPGAAAAAGASPLPGGLAAAVLPFPGQRTAGYPAA